jgi:catechol 2,3-dioxygenase-like lactoylglutathione lyase family enzyme
MKVSYVVLYVEDPDSCFEFWTKKVGMIEKSRKIVAEMAIVQVGFADQDFALELVPLALMASNPDGLDLATPSIAFAVDDLAETQKKLLAAGVQATDPGEHSGVRSFAFCDNENRWFAVIQSS